MRHCHVSFSVNFRCSLDPIISQLYTRVFIYTCTFHCFDGDFFYLHRSIQISNKRRRHDTEERVAMVINAKNGNMLHTNKVDITLFVFPVYLYYLFSSSNVHTRVRLVACPTSVYTGEWMGL